MLLLSIAVNSSRLWLGNRNPGMICWFLTCLGIAWFEQLSVAAARCYTHLGHLRPPATILLSE